MRPMDGEFDLSAQFSVKRVLTALYQVGVKRLIGMSRATP